MKCRKTGMTLVELLVVLGIIALLAGVLIPALTIVQRTAKETKQKAQFSHMELALVTFKNDYGDYPPSALSPGFNDYCGAQKLAEALVGWDLLGFHPRSDFRATGYNDDNIFIYDAVDTILFDQRKPPYLDLGFANAFRLGNSPIDKPGLFLDTTPLAPDTYVICDVFGKQKVRLTNGQTVTAGAPILYYRANTSQKIIRDIYNVQDNEALVLIKQQADGRVHPLADPSGLYQFFYGTDNTMDGIVGYIQDPKITARAWPYRSDSYILISAGSDGLYGTSDDIRNFGN